MQRPSLRTIATVALIAAAFSLAACTRSASTPPTAAGTQATSSPLTGQQATMEAVRSALLTQTAQAGVPEASATAIPSGGGVMTATPSSGTPAAGAGGLTTATNTPLPIPTLTVPESYTLHEGEFPYCLARRFNRNPDDLLAINGLTNSSLTVPGQTLRIPTSGTFPGPRALLSHPTSYSVAGGDTIYSIACRFGDVDPLAIAAVNGLSSPYTLTPGSVIQIP
jgi:LysM repeat protein